MSDPTEAEIKTQGQNAVKLFEHLRTAGGTASPNLIGLIDTIEQASEGDFLKDQEDGLGGIRNGYADIMFTPAKLLMDSIIRSYGRVLQFPETDPARILLRLHRHYADNALSVESRVFTFGSPAALTANIGNGLLHRLTTDAYSEPIEAQVADGKIAECIADEHSGSREHEEEFEIRADVAEKDIIKIVGSGRVGRLKGISARTSTRWIGNPSFDLGTSASTVTDWAIETGAFSSTSKSSTIYRDFAGASTSYSLELSDNIKFSQNFNVRNAQFNPAIPYYIQVAVQRTASLTGTFTLTFGNVSASVDVSTLSNGSWSILRIAVGANNWHRQFNKEDPKVILELSSASTAGTLLVDDISMGELSPFDGSWYALVGGATPFLRHDQFTWEDSEVGAKIQRWLHRLYGLYLPSATGSAVTWSDPA